MKSAGEWSDVTNQYEWAAEGDDGAGERAFRAFIRAVQRDVLETVKAKCQAADDIGDCLWEVDHMKEQI